MGLAVSGLKTKLFFRPGMLRSILAEGPRPWVRSSSSSSAPPPLPGVLKSDHVADPQSQDHPDLSEGKVRVCGHMTPFGAQPGASV